MEWFGAVIEKIGLGSIFQRQEEESRLTRRAVVEIEALATGADLKPFPITILDISLQGFRFTSRRKTVRGEFLLIKVERPGKSRAAINGRVIWARARKRGEYMGGLCYAQTDTRTREDWVEFVLDHTGFSVEELAQKRRSYRIPSVLLVSWQFRDEKEGDAIGRDISLGGLLLQSKEYFAQEDELSLILRSTADGSALRLSGFVAGVRRAKDGTFLVGVAFQKLTAATRRRLIHFISEIIHRRQLPGQEAPGEGQEGHVIR
jgi:hypothetical protein